VITLARAFQCRQAPPVWLSSPCWRRA
jgi:hypothetical protein